MKLSAVYPHIHIALMVDYCSMLVSFSCLIPVIVMLWFYVQSLSVAA